MRMLDIAEMYVAVCVYNDDTQDKVLGVARLFDERAGIVDIEVIDYQSIQRFKEVCLSEVGVLPVTYNGYVRYLKLLNRWAVDEGLMQKNWFERIKFAPIPVRRPKGLEDEVFIAAFHYLKTHPQALSPSWFWQIVIRFFYSTGIRRRQLVSIEMQDLDLENKVLIANHRGSKTHREWEIPLTDTIIPDLEYLIQKNEDALGRPMEPEDRLFNVCRFNPRYAPDKNNPNAMTRESVTGFMKRLSRQIGMTIGAHRIRHTTATVLCNPENDDEPDLFSVQHILGHTMLSTTRGYVHTKLSRPRKLLNRLSLPK